MSRKKWLSFFHVVLCFGLAISLFLAVLGVINAVNFITVYFRMQSMIFWVWQILTMDLYLEVRFTGQEHPEE